MTVSGRVGHAVTRVVGVLVAASVFGAVLVAAIPADARTPVDPSTLPTCLRDGDYGLGGVVEDQGGENYLNSRGTLASVWTNNRVPSCQYVSSAYVLTNSRFGFFEFGYVQGTSACDGKGYTKPRFFYWAQTTTGKTTCGVLSKYIAGDGKYHAIRASDLNGNMVWGGWLDGVELMAGSAGVKLDFYHGMNQVSMERGGEGDQPFARWNYVQEWHKTNDWTYWNNGRCHSSGHARCHVLNAHTFYVD